MDNIMKMLRDITRSIGNHGRRIRRLETLQTPITLSRPQGGHIIQDEGVSLPDQVNLNFVGVRVSVIDDPGSGATIVTVSDPEGDDFCRVVPLETGWRINAGIDELRYLEHGTSFRLSSGGNTRGSYAIDLQQVRFNDDDVAAGDFSIILGGEENEMSGTLGGEYSVIGGSYNFIKGDSTDNWILGENNWLGGTASGCYGMPVLGISHTHTDSQYGLIGGYNNDGSVAFGCTMLGEGNDINANANDNPYYCGVIGILNVMEGDVFECFQQGEANAIYGDGTSGGDDCWMCWQWGYSHFLSEGATNVFQFGRQTESYIPIGGDQGMYAGRMLLSGDGPQELSSNTGGSRGMNQDSWFSQNTGINTWPSAWTSSRFQFPIIEDSIWYFEAMIAGVELGCANSYAWKIEGVVENDGGTTTILNSVVTNFYRDVVTKEWQVVADDANDRLVFQYRDTAGPDATRANIQFRMMTSEAGYEY